MYIQYKSTNLSYARYIYIYIVPRVSYILIIYMMMMSAASVMVVLMWFVISLLLSSSPSVVVVVCSSSSSSSDVVVSKDGSGDYRSVSEAIREAPEMSEKAYRIHVRKGTYDEYVFIPPHKLNIHLLGDGPRRSLIVGYHGSTIDIRGEGFMAHNMGFVNAGGPGIEASEAVAVRNEANNTVFYGCSIEGFQDTLWAVSGRQFYKNCDIYGTVDFIYGAAAAVFQDCMLYARYRQHVTFTAQSREHPEQNTAFTFQRCKFTRSPEAEAESNWEVQATLGRPWRAYSRVAIMNSYLDWIVEARGWEEMPGQPTDKVTYVEYQNVGPGSNTTGRVKWAGVKLLTHPAQAAPFTPSRLLDAHSWIPSTGVPYDDGL